jgi:hypothetical protein
MGRPTRKDLLLDSLHAEGLSIQAVDEIPNGQVRLVWRGRSGARNPGEVLKPYFKSVLTGAESNRLAVQMHFEHLDHFNSSTVAVLIHLIQDARSRGVPLVFVYDQNLKWQKLSFDAMRVFVKSDGLLQMKTI